LSGNQIIGSQIGFNVNKVLSNLRVVLENIEESLFSISADGESIFDLLEPGLFFLVNLLAVGSISIKGLLGFVDGFDSLDHLEGL